MNIKSLLSVALILALWPLSHSFAASALVDFGSAGGSPDTCPHCLQGWNTIDELGSTVLRASNSPVSVYSIDIDGDGFGLDPSSADTVRSDYLYSDSKWSIKLSATDPQFLRSTNMVFFAPSDPNVPIGLLSINGQVIGGNLRKITISNYLGMESELLIEGSTNGNASARVGLAGFQLGSPVPIPGAIWLFGSALIGLVGVARRKKASLLDHHRNG